MNAPTQQQPSLAVRIASALFEIEMAEPSRRSRKVLWSVCALISVLIVWACLAKLDIVAVATGRLVPKTFVKIVQPAEAGVIREILVKEGESVERDEVLIRLDPTINAVNSEAISQELALERLQLRRIKAELSGLPLVRESVDDPLLFAQVEAQLMSRRQAYLASVAQEKAAREQAVKELVAARELLEKLEATLPSYQQSARAYEKLAEEQLVGTLVAVEQRREAIEHAQDVEAQRATVASLEASVSQNEERLAQLESNHVSDLHRARLETVTAINRLEQQLGQLNYKQELLELRAPQDGIVTDLATTTIGAVVQPGTVLLNLVPQDEPLLAEVMIENQDIGFVEPGQPVRIKLAAYEFQKYGMIDGVVRTISADSSPRERVTPTGQSEQPIGTGLAFTALIELKNQRLGANGLNLPLAAGMQVTAEIKQGKRTVLEYLLSPVERVVSEAAMER